MDKKLIVKQNGLKDCGPSCLLSIMKYYGVEASHEEVSFILKTNINGTNALNIINGSKTFGFDGFGIKYSYDEIINNNISFPIICHVNKNNLYHFIVVYNVKKDYLIVMDPSSSIHKLHKEDFKKMYLGVSLVIYPIKKINNLSPQKELKEHIINCLYLERKNIIKLLILSFITIVLSTISNYFTLSIIDYIVPNYTLNLLVKISIIFLIISITKSILNYIKNKSLITLENNISKNINNEVIRKLFNLPYLFFKNKSTGEIISRINDLKLFKELFSQIILNISNYIIMILISLSILLIINTKLFIIFLIEMILYFIIVISYKRIYRVKTEEVLESESVYNKILNESIYGYESNRNINMINNSIKKIEISYISYLLKVKNLSSLLNNQNLLKDLLVDTTEIISLVLSAILIVNKNITTGEFILFNTLSYYFTEPIKNILDLEPNINLLKNVYRRLYDLLITREESSSQNEIELNGDIKIINLYYSQDGYNNIFENIQINIPFKSKYLIYGNSGNGKSTLIKILLKYLNDYKGNIFIGNLNLKDIDRNTISNNFTYVSQNSYLNNDTLINNIIYGRDISLENYEEMIDICNLDNFRNSKKLRNNFLIEEDGFNISGGERQKVILARSLLKSSNYIILDEALSEVGIDEEKEIIKKIFKKFSDKTIIYISHKEEIIKEFNQKYKLERSKGAC